MAALAEIPPGRAGSVSGGVWGRAETLAPAPTSSGREQLVVQLLRTLFGWPGAHACGQKL